VVVVVVMAVAVVVGVVVVVVVVGWEIWRHKPLIRYLKKSTFPINRLKNKMARCPKMVI
jgi:hypothetical protein